MIVQGDGKIVAGGSRGGFMTLVRYNVNGTIDTSFGSGGFATQQFAGTPNGGARHERRGGDDAGRRGQDRRRRLRRLAVDGRRPLHARPASTSASAVCYAPHLIDYTARAVAVKPNGSIVLAGYGRDRHASAAVPPTGPSVLYGLRAVVTLPA